MSIRSGSVFVWDEREAGMRRWTDGKSWSASRVSGSFLTYREMEGKRGGSSVFIPPMGRAGKSPNPDGSDSDGMDGDGPDGYRYKADGLIKQSFSITTSTLQKLHLISYFSRSHSVSQPLPIPTQDPSLKHIRPAMGMYPESTVHEQQNVPSIGPPPMANHHSPVPAYSHAHSHSHSHSQSLPRQSIAHSGGFNPHQFNNYAWPPSPVTTPPTTIQMSQYVLHAHPPAQSQAGSPGTSSMSYSHGNMPSFHSASSSSSSSSSATNNYPNSSESPRMYERPSLPQLDGLTSRPSGHRNSLGLQHPSPRTTPVQIRHPSPPSGLMRANQQQQQQQLSNNQYNDRYSASPSNSVHTSSPREINPLRASIGGDVDVEMRSLDVQDIPSEKLGFGEDMRALRVLDRAFAA